MLLVNKEGSGSSSSSFGAWFVGAIELHKECAGGFVTLVVVQEHLSLLHTASGFGCNVDTATSAWVIFILDVGCRVGCLAMLVQQAIPGIVLVSYKDSGAWRQLAQGNGKGGMQPPCEVQGR